MNANGQYKDPTDEDEAMNAETRDDGAADENGEGEKVSPVATSDKQPPVIAPVGAPPGGTHSSAKISKQQTEKSGLSGMLQFVAESMIELKKITWPDRQQVIKETMSVIVLVAIITACVLAFDYGIAKAVFEPLDKLARHLGGGIGVHH